MSGVSGRLLGSVRSLVAGLVLVSPTLAFGAEATLVQQIGELSSDVAEAVAAEVDVVPFSPTINARATPIIVAPGELFLTRDGGQVRGLSGPERRALRQAYDAGQTILLLHASAHDIEALHLLLEDGVKHQSSSDPTVLAYALRQESDIPKARIVHDLRPSLPAPGGAGPDFDDEGALQRALDVVISELIHPPVVAAAAVVGAAVSTNWTQLQATTITVNSNGTYNTPVDIYALHHCAESKDCYLVDTGGDWTATEAAFTSASQSAGQITLNADASNVVTNFQAGTQYCTAGIDVAGNQDERVCRYTPYPLWYEVDIVPPNGPTVVQVNAEPAGDQGQSADYSSGFSFNLTGDVSIEGVIQAGVSWDNEVTTTVPALVIDAGDMGNEGRFTRYLYCTIGSTAEDCTSNIQMTNPSGDICLNYIVGQPQQGQTPNGSLSDVAQTVYWQVDPATYGGNTTFDVTVTWQVNMAFSQGLFWNGQFIDKNAGIRGGPSGYCNLFGCSCMLPFTSNIDTHSLTFQVPIPSGSNCPSG
jgi:hypothetical protein